MLKNWPQKYSFIEQWNSRHRSLKHLSWLVKNSAWLEKVPAFGNSSKNYAVWSRNRAQIQLLQYAACPFNYKVDLGRGTDGSVNYEMGWAMNASLLKWLHIFSLTYKSPWTLSDNQFVSVLLTAICHHPKSDNKSRQDNTKTI